MILQEWLWTEIKLSWSINCSFSWTRTQVTTQSINQSINQSVSSLNLCLLTHLSYLSSLLLSSPLFSSILSSFNLLLILLVFNCFVFFLSLSFRIHFVAGWIKNVFVCMCYHTSCFLSSYSCSCSLRHSILAPWYCMNMYTETHRHR